MRVSTVRSLQRRFLNRRAVVWLALTAAIAVLITINERRQAVGPVGGGVKEVALATSEKPSKKLGPPPTIRAPYDEKSIDALKRPERLVESKSEADRSSAAPEPAAKPAEDDYGSRVAGEIPADRRGGTAREEPAAPELAKEPNAPVATLPAAPPTGMPKSGPVRTKSGTIAGKAGGALLSAKKDSAAAFGGSGTEQYLGTAGVAKQATQSDERVLVVRCDISPEAAQRRSFEKLLDANGIAWQEQSGADKGKEKVADDAKRSPLGQSMLRQANGAGEVNLVYVEATPAQLAATLAGLKAQPNVFLSFSVSPAQGELQPEISRQLVANERLQRKSAVGGEQGFQAKAAAGVKLNAPPTVVEYQQRVQAAGPQAGPGAVGQLDKTVRQHTAQPTQRVVFVLNVVGGDHPPALAKPAAPPASAPTQGK